VDIEEAVVDGEVEQTPSKDATASKMKASPVKPGEEGKQQEAPEVPDVYAKPLGFF